MADLHTTTLPASSEIRAAWDRAVADLRALEEEYALISPQHTAAFDAAEAACPREPEFFSRYDLGCYEDEERGLDLNLRAARMSIAVERSRALGRTLTAEETMEVHAEALRVVDRFRVWVKRRDEAHAQHDCEQLEEQFNAIVDKRYQAQLAVIRAAAPDPNAIRVKLELLVTMMDGEQDQQSVAAICDDAQRLLAA